MTFDDKLEQLSKEAKKNYDSLVPVNDLKFHSNGKFELSVKGEKFPLNRTGFKTLCSRIGVPHEYFAANPLKETARHVNHWLEHIKLRELYIRVQDGQVRGVLSPKFEPYDNLDLLLDIKEYVRDTFLINLYEQEYKLEVKVSLTDEYNDSEDTRMILGLVAANSELDDLPVIVGYGLTRKKCMNDITLNNTGTGRPFFKRSHRGINPEQVKQGIAQTIVAARNQGEQRARLFTDMRNKALDNQAIEYIYSDLEDKRIFQKTFILQVRKTPIEEHTLYGLANQLTAAAKNLSFAQRRLVEEFVGNRLPAYVGSL